MGLTGLEPVTLRLSSACSNQLSYRPATRLRLEISEFRFPIFEWSRGILRAELLKSTIANRKSKMKWLAESQLAAFASTRPKSPPSPELRRDNLRSPVRRERRLEARGFEPLTSSLQSWRSTN